MGKHITSIERAVIEKLLSQDCTFAYIARQLGKSPATISREVKSRRQFIKYVDATYYECLNFRNCIRNSLCASSQATKCKDRCKLCTRFDCTKICSKFTSIHCHKLNKAPFVCNSCPESKQCKKIHAFYFATKANTNYKNTLSDSRSGIRTSQERLMEINAILDPLVKKGQSINHILATHKAEIGLSEKTIYNYIDMRAFSVSNMDLPRKVKYRPRRKQSEIFTSINYRYRQDRTFEDFNTFTEANPHIEVVEMDTVKSGHGSKSTLLTFIFRNSNFMLIFLMPDGTQKSVLEVFDNLTLKLGIDMFRKLFPVILTDNGVEFKDANKLETSSTGVFRTRIFYCDPQASWQKAQIEKNHELIRTILPKGTKFNHLTDGKIQLITNHINSVARGKFQNKTPFELMQTEPQKILLDTLGLHQIPPDEVCLKPKLLKL